MINIYNKYRKFILPPLFIISVLILTVVLSSDNSILAKKHWSRFLGFKHFKSNFDNFRHRVLGDRDEQHDEDHDEEDEDHKNHDKQKDDGLTCGFNDGAIFNVTNMLPGDYEQKQITVKNENTYPVLAYLKGTRTGPDGEIPPYFEDVLDFEIKEGLNNIYYDKLINFLSLSNGVNLGLINPNEIGSFNLLVNFPEIVGNEYQNKVVIFDLLCKNLSANHIGNDDVFNDDDESQEIDNKKDRDSFKIDEVKEEGDE